MYMNNYNCCACTVIVELVNGYFIPVLRCVHMVWVWVAVEYSHCLVCCDAAVRAEPTGRSLSTPERPPLLHSHLPP